MIQIDGPASSLLLTLEQISELVSHSHDLGDTLKNIVRLIQKLFGADVCSVYLLEAERNELVLSATIGLAPQSVGRVRMGLHEGLTGLVAERMKPVMEQDARNHPRFKYFPGAGEDPYRSFLGVPLVEAGQVQGVLVIQTVAARTFSLDETRMLVAVAAQLASLVGNANLVSRLTQVAGRSVAPLDQAATAAGSEVLHGTPLSPGLGMGRALVIDQLAHLEDLAAQPAADRRQEERRLRVALERSREEIDRLCHRISAMLGEEHGAFMQVHMLILQDRQVQNDLVAAIRGGLTAESALAQVLRQFLAAFEKLDNPLFRDRIYDIRDVFRRIFGQLQPGAASVAINREPVVLVARDVSAMDIFAIDLDRVQAIAVERGGAESHAAILARSLGIPMVSNLPRLAGHLAPGTFLIADGTEGTLHLNPAPGAITTYQDLARRLGGRDRSAGRGAGAGTVSPKSPGPSHPARAIDPAPLEPTDPEVDVNISLPGEIPLALADGAQGVGLYRSEFLFLARRTMPSEEEQIRIYERMIGLLKGRTLTIRTLDLRPEKMTGATGPTTAEAHWWDWRLVLQSPPVQAVFRTQLRAILRAARLGPVQVLLPVVSSLEQIEFVTRSIRELQDALADEGLAFAPAVRLGVMVEVPAAVVLLATWLDRMDFVSVGTNDLAHYCLGIERDDASLDCLYDPLHPAVIRTLASIIATAHAARKRVTVCGELAADPLGTVALKAMGVDAVSVSPVAIQAVRETVRRVSDADFTGLGDRIARATRSADVRALLAPVLHRDPAPPTPCAALP